MSYTNHHILEFLEDWAPQSTKLEYDNVGLLIGNKDKEVSKVVACLDVTSKVADEAITLGADLIIAHHPLIFRKLSRITSSDAIGALIYRLIRNDINLIAAHTNLDAAPGGVSFVLAEKLGLQNTRFLRMDENGDPADTRETGFGVIGALPQAMDVQEFLAHVGDRLGSEGIRYSGSPEWVKNVAVCGGAGSFLSHEALRQEADAFLTADLKYHDFFTESASFLLVDAGHYESEVPVVGALCDRLRDRFPEIEVHSTRVNTNPVNYVFRQQHQKMK